MIYESLKQIHLTLCTHPTNNSCRTMNLRPFLSFFVTVVVTVTGTTPVPVYSLRMI